MFKLETILSARSSNSEMGLSDLINKLKQKGSENWSLGHGGKASEQCVFESRDRLSGLRPNCFAVTVKICSYKAKFAFRNILLTEAFVLLRCYTSYVGRCLRACGTAYLFPSQGSINQRKVFYCLTLKDGTDRLSLNVSEQVST